MKEKGFLSKQQVLLFSTESKTFHIYVFNNQYVELQMFIVLF